MVILVAEAKQHDGYQAMEEEEEEDPQDHLSDIPDDILAYILSLLCNTHEAIETSTLSSRWRHLWKYAPSLYFSYPPNVDKSNFPNFVTKVLDHHKAARIDTFKLSWFTYKKEESHQVDSWIHHAVAYKPREILLNFASHLKPKTIGSRLINSKELYELPPCFSSNITCVKQITLELCKLEITPFSRFNFLWSVQLSWVSLGDGAIKNLTAASPCLRYLMIHNCTWEASILHIENANLHYLDITKDDGGPAGDITIHAPNLSGFYLTGTILMGRCFIKDLPSSATLTLDFDKMLDIRDGEYKEADGDRLIELLLNLRHVSFLRLRCGWCLQVLSIRGMIETVQHFHNPPLNTVKLQLKTCLRSWELSGIAYLLKSCPKLQELTIDIVTCNRYKLNVDFFDILGNYNFDEREYWKAQEMRSSSCVLKTVKITGFTGFAYMCATEKENTGFTEEAVKSINNEIEFINALLKNLVALEKMIIITKKGFNLLLQRSQLLDKAVRELLVYLKASPKVEIIVL